MPSVADLSKREQRHKRRSWLRAHNRAVSLWAHAKRAALVVDELTAECPELGQAAQEFHRARERAYAAVREVEALMARDVEETLGEAS